MQVTVFGAYGHTGRFIVAELRRRGWTAVLSGRDRERLEALRETFPGSECRVASTEAPDSLDAALSGSAAVINAAGPFLDTSGALIEAAIRARIPYLDIAAEQPAVLSAFERFADEARRAGVVVMPAMAFYGGLGDLMASAAMAGWDSADEISIAVALDSWKPTRGTRLTGERNHGPRFVFSNGSLTRGELPPERTWGFPPPFGEQEVVPLPLAETIVIPRHLRVRDLRMFLSSAPIAELRNPDTPPPSPSDETGRSAQIFTMDVVVRRGAEDRRLIVRGRDIYAVSAPLVVEAMERIVAGRVSAAGVVAPGEVFDALNFLRALGADSAIEIA
jgi:hypothetical protein